jgi:hypothetical protein
MKKALLVALLAAVAAGAWVGLMQWSSYVAARNDDQLYRAAATLQEPAAVGAIFTSPRRLGCVNCRSCSR